MEKDSRFSFEEWVILAGGAAVAVVAYLSTNGFGTNQTNPNDDFSPQRSYSIAADSLIADNSKR